MLTRDITDRLELESARVKHTHALSQEAERLSSHLHELFVASMTALVHVLGSQRPVHSRPPDRVSEMAGNNGHACIAKSLRPSELALLAGKLHDIGKVGLRTEVLNKPGPLDEDEWIMFAATRGRRTHSLSHRQAIRSYKDRPPSPRKIRRKATLTALQAPTYQKDPGSFPADAYDAMTSNRPYREASTQGWLQRKSGQNAENRLSTLNGPSFSLIFLRRGQSDNRQATHCEYL